MPFELAINNLYYHYANKAVLSGITFTASQAGIIGLLGLNGEGKSTLLRLIAGILPDTSHSISLSGIASASTNPVGLLPERPLFYPELSVLENLQFAARIQGVSADAIKQRIKTTLELCQLQPRQHILASNLSKGFSQRLGLAMAIVHQPALLLLDEPTDGLDPQQIEDTHALIRQLAQTSIVIISSHRLDEINRLSDRLLILHHGQLRFDDSRDKDSPDDIANLFQQITSEASR